MSKKTKETGPDCPNCRLHAMVKRIPDLTRQDGKVWSSYICPGCQYRKAFEREQTPGEKHATATH